MGAGTKLSGSQVLDVCEQVAALTAVDRAGGVGRLRRSDGSGGAWMPAAGVGGLPMTRLQRRVRTLGVGCVPGRRRVRILGSVFVPGWQRVRTLGTAFVPSAPCSYRVGGVFVPSVSGAYLDRALWTHKVRTRDRVGPQDRLTSEPTDRPRARAGSASASHVI